MKPEIIIKFDIWGTSPPFCKYFEPSLNDSRKYMMALFKNWATNILIINEIKYFVLV